MSNHSHKMTDHDEGDFVYIVNLTNQKLSLNKGLLTLPPLGYVRRLADFAKEESVKYAEARNWLKVTATRPSTPESGVPPSVLSHFDSMKGMTKEELQASLLADHGKTLDDAIDFSKQTSVSVDPSDTEGVGTPAEGVLPADVGSPVKEEDLSVENDVKDIVKVKPEKAEKHHDKKVEKAEKKVEDDKKAD